MTGSMGRYHTALALLAEGRDEEALVRQAFRVAMRQAERLVLAGLVEVANGAEFDPNPLAAAGDLFQDLVRVREERLRSLAQGLGGDVTVVVEVRQGKWAAAQLADRLGVDLVMVGRGATYHLDERPSRWAILPPPPFSFEVMVLEEVSTPLKGPMRRTWALALADNTSWRRALS